MTIIDLHLATQADCDAFGIGISTELFLLQQRLTRLISTANATTHPLFWSLR